MIDGRQETTTIAVLCLVMSYVACKITCNPMFYRSIEVHLPYLGYPIKIGTSVFLYPLTFVICDLISTLLPRKQTLFIIIFGAACDGFFSYITHILSFFSIPHITRPLELQLIQAVNLLGPYMWLLFYRGVMASIITTLAEVTLFTLIFRKIKSINLSIICSVTTVLVVHNLVLNYPLRQREANGTAMVIYGLIFEIIFLIFYILLISVIKKFWDNKSFQGSTTYFAKNIINVIDKLSYKERHTKKINNTFREVAHNIQSPILILDSVVSTLEEHSLYKDYIDDLKSAVTAIQSLATEMLENVRNDITDINREPQDNLERIKVNKLIKTEISSKYTEYGKIFALNFKDHNPEFPHLIFINPAKLKQILSNVLNNARDALIDSNDKKEILIEIFENNENVEIIITNHGNIIPTDRISDAINGISTKHMGEGIGLISSIKYLKKINARLAISSSYNDGTKVNLIFPKQT